MVPEDPVNTWAGTVPAPPANVGTPTGHEIVCAGPVTVPLVPAAVTLCVCAASAAVLPLMVIDELVGTPTGHEATWAGPVTVPLVPTGVKLTVPLVPAGVPALTAEVFAELPVKTGAATVPVGVNAAVAFVPAGVIASAPPVPPASPCAAIVPIGIFPSSTVNSSHPGPQTPEVIIFTTPAVPGAPSIPISCPRVRYGLMHVNVITELRTPIKIPLM